MRTGICGWPSSSTRRSRRRMRWVWRGGWRTGAVRYSNPLRKFRKQQRRELKARGVRPTRTRRAVCVRLVGMEVPAWFLEHRIRHLSATAHTVWLWPRAAKHLEHLADEMGSSATLAEAEFRLCDICGRPLLGEDAEARRRVVESAVTGRQKPCGAECIEAEQDGRWRVREK